MFLYFRQKKVKCFKLWTENGEKKLLAKVNRKDKFLRFFEFSDIFRLFRLQLWVSFLEVLGISKKDYLIYWVFYYTIKFLLF